MTLTDPTPKTTPTPAAPTDWVDWVPAAKHYGSITAFAVVVAGAVRNFDAAGLAGWLLIADLALAFAITTWLSWPDFRTLTEETP